MQELNREKCADLLYMLKKFAASEQELRYSFENISELRQGHFIQLSHKSLKLMKTSRAYEYI